MTTTTKSKPKTKQERIEWIACAMVEVCSDFGYYTTELLYEHCFRTISKSTIRRLTPEAKVRAAAIR